MASYSTKGLDHLSLVTCMNKELGIAKIIDQVLPGQCDGKLISYGQLVEAMILMGLALLAVPYICTHTTLKSVLLSAL